MVVTALNTTTLWLSGLLILLVYIDVGYVTATVDPLLGLKLPNQDPFTIANTLNTIETAYYAIFFILLILSLIAIPTAQSYLKQAQSNHGNEEIEMNVWHAPIVGAILFIVMVIGAYSNLAFSSPLNIPWFNNILLHTGFQKAMALMMGVISVLSFHILLFQTSIGMTMLPASLWYRKREKKERLQELTLKQSRLERLMARLEQKVQGNSISDVDQERLDGWVHEHARLSVLIEAERDVPVSSPDMTDQISQVSSAFVCLVLLLLSGIVCFSLLLNLADKFSHTCGPTCKYLLAIVQFTTPLDSLFLSSSFVGGMFLFVGLWLFVQAATVSTLYKVGLRMIGIIPICHFRVADTSPIKMGYLTMVISLTTPAFILLFSSLAPIYAMFGGQVYCNNVVNNVRSCAGVLNQIYYCNINGPPLICTPSAIGQMVSRILYVYPIFSTFFYYLEWIFLGLVPFGLYLSYRLNFVSPSKVVDDDEESDETSQLLRSESEEL